MAEVDKALNRWLTEVCKAVAEKLKVLSADSKKRGLVKALKTTPWRWSQTGLSRGPKRCSKFQSDG